MRLLIVTVVLLQLSLTVQAQQTINKPLQHELDSILRQDQKYRELMNLQSPAAKDSLAAIYHVTADNLGIHLWQLQEKADSCNIIRVAEIIKQYGYPGKTLVDSPANEAVFNVIQHSNVIDQYLPLVKSAAENRELPFRLYAMMLDRSLMYQHKPQIYGTQGKGIYVYDATTGKKKFVMIIWPVQDVATVNERRNAAGFSQTIEENASRLGISYTPFTMEDLEKMQAKK